MSASGTKALARAWACIAQESSKKQASISPFETAH